MRKLTTLAVLAFFAWLVITFTWATAAHLTGLPGPAQASAATIASDVDRAIEGVEAICRQPVVSVS